MRQLIHNHNIGMKQKNCLYIQFIKPFSFIKDCPAWYYRQSFNKCMRFFAAMRFDIANFYIDTIEQ